MALQTKVIVNEVKNLSDARYCAGMGVDMLGFRFDNNGPVDLSAEDLKAIMGWVEGVKYIGTFKGGTAAKINTVCDEYGLDYVIVDDTTSLETMSDIERDIILSVNFSNGVAAALMEELKHYRSNCRYILLESHEESDAMENAVLLKSLAENYHVLIGFGITKGNIDELIATVKPEGIALKGGDEERPGYKDYDELADILEVIEIE